MYSFSLLLTPLHQCMAACRRDGEMNMEMDIEMENGLATQDSTYVKPVERFIPARKADTTHTD